MFFGIKTDLTPALLIELIDTLKIGSSANFDSVVYSRSFNRQMASDILCFDPSGDQFISSCLGSTRCTEK